MALVFCPLAFGQSVALPGVLGEVQTGRVAALAFSPDVRSLFVATAERVELWEVRTEAKIQEYRAHTGIVWCLALSPDGQRLYTGGVDQRVFLWDVPSGRSLASVILPAGVFALAFGEDLLAVGLGDGRVFLLDPRDLRVRGELRTESSIVLALATEGSGRYLVGAGDDGTIYIWHVPTRERIGSFSAHRSAVWSVALSPDGKTLATASADGTVRLWSFPAGRELATLGGYKAGAWGVAFVRRGEFLVASFGDLTVRIWKPPVWEKVGALRAHKATIRSVAAHEHLLATASEDGRIIVWDVNELLSLRPHVLQVLFSREIAQSQYIVVNFADANGDVVGVKLLVEEEHPGTVRLSPAASFDPKVRGRTQGTFGFSVTVTRPQNVRITIILTDALGLQSPLFLIAFVAR